MVGFLNHLVRRIEINYLQFGFESTIVYSVESLKSNFNHLVFHIAIVMTLRSGEVRKCSLLLDTLHLVTLCFHGRTSYSLLSHEI